MQPPSRFSAHKTSPSFQPPAGFYEALRPIAVKHLKAVKHHGLTRDRRRADPNTARSIVPAHVFAPSQDGRLAGLVQQHNAQPCQPCGARRLIHRAQLPVCRVSSFLVVVAPPVWRLTASATPKPSAFVFSMHWRWAAISSAISEMRLLICASLAWGTGFCIPTAWADFDVVTLMRVKFGASPSLLSAALASLSEGTYQLLGIRWLV